MSEKRLFARIATCSTILLLSMTLGCKNGGDTTPTTTNGGGTTPATTDGGGTTTAATNGEMTASERGYLYLLTRTYGQPSDVNAKVLESLFLVWPDHLREKAKLLLHKQERLKMTYDRYGLLVTPPDAPNVAEGEPGHRTPDVPLNYSVGADGKWVTNCFLCHAGKVAGNVIPGINNTGYALHTYLEDLQNLGKLQAKLEPLKKPDPQAAAIAAALDAFIPLTSLTDGTSNAFGQSEFLLSFRDLELNYYKTPQRTPPQDPYKLLDTETPAWFNTKKKTMVYWDGFIEKTPRDLMQFVLTPNNGPDVVKSWAADFVDILAWIDNLEVPKYPFTIDTALAQQGQLVFINNCTQCHGTYGPGGTYPQRLIPLSEIGTDPVRTQGMQVSYRQFLRDSWLGADGTGPGGKAIIVEDPQGYQAPPLDGIWATAPYFHNGSVPTLVEVLNPSKRPKVWLRKDVGEVSGYDQVNVGLQADRFDALPPGVTPDTWDSRQYFQTNLRGKSEKGHNFPATPLPDDQAKALLEYLKTL